MKTQTHTALEGKSLIYWRIAQVVVGIVGWCIFIALIFFPEIGIHAFWNVLIPIAPLLLVIASGLWRNICPLASTSLLSRHLGISKNKRLNVKQQERLQLTSVILLFLIIPLRHTTLDTNGPATALIIGIFGIIAVYVGYNYSWKSAWCSGLCPINPVEKLYGRKNAIKLPNAHCSSCVNCLSICPDSTPSMRPVIKKKRKSLQKITSTLMIGGFPGYIWGWFHVQDYANNEGWNHLISTYAFPLASMLITLILFIVLKKMIPKKQESLLINIFATTAVSTYYWYRIPAIIGFGIFPGDGMLIDLSNTIPSWTPMVVQIAFSMFFAWWIIYSKKDAVSWLVRPPYEKNIKSIHRVTYSAA